MFIIFRVLTDRKNTFAILSKIDRSELVCFIRTSSREEKLLLETYDENGKRVTDREAGRQAGSRTVKNAGDYRDTTKRGQPALARSPAITILSFFRPACDLLPVSGRQSDRLSFISCPRSGIFPTIG